MDEYIAGTYKKECMEQGKKYFSVASGGGTGRTLHPDNMAAGPASYGMTDTMGRMHSDAKFNTFSHNLILLKPLKIRYFLEFTSLCCFFNRNSKS